eukprot:3301755-Alexandrium_andersonii.AAC.1
MDGLPRRLVAQRGGRQWRPEGRGRPRICEAALRPAGSVSEQFLARPRPALTGRALAHPDPKKTFPARAGAAFRR